MNVSTTRFKVWKELSDLYLDIELEEVRYRHIAEVIIESGYGPEQIKQILWNEVHPILASNLRSAAGVWTGWSDEWLQQHLREAEGPVQTSSDRAITREIE